MSDNDNKPVILERWDQCDLNPASPNYLAKKIGDKYEEYDTTLLGNRTYGTHPNRSLFVRVVMDGDVDAGVADAQHRLHRLCCIPLCSFTQEEHLGKP